MPKKPLVILITGCSSGFGLLTAARLASEGHCVHATMRDLNKKDPLDIEARRRHAQKNLFIHQMDVTDPVSIKKAVVKVLDRDGVIDVLINNAGFGMGGFFEDLSDEDWRKQYDTNFFGVLNVIREVLPVMRPRRRGRIINISSVAAFSGSPSLGAYVSSKWALEGFSESLCMELKPFNIDVILVEPGSYRTKIFTDNARYAQDFNNEKSPYFAMSRKIKGFVDGHVAHSHRDPEEAAKVIADVATSDKPRFRNIIGVQSKLRCWIVRHVPFEFYAHIVTRLLFGKKKTHA
jgi:NAD(P)-dependent dehydrogenase (short-subunit alcohol dehydrogenase family)